MIDWLLALGLVLAFCLIVAILTLVLHVLLERWLMAGVVVIGLCVFAFMLFLAHGLVTGDLEIREDGRIGLDNDP